MNNKIILFVLVALLISSCVPTTAPEIVTKANMALQSDKVVQQVEQKETVATTYLIWWLRSGVGDTATKLTAVPSGSEIIVKVDNLVANDGGIWWLVSFDGYSGYINSRCCQ